MPDPKTTLPSDCTFGRSCHPPTPVPPGTHLFIPLAVLSLGARVIITDSRPFGGAGSLSVPAGAKKPIARNAGRRQQMRRGASLGGRPAGAHSETATGRRALWSGGHDARDRKSTRLNSSH